jgi:hypothetical protein
VIVGGMGSWGRFSLQKLNRFKAKTFSSVLCETAYLFKALSILDWISNDGSLIQSLWKQLPNLLPNQPVFVKTWFFCLRGSVIPFPIGFCYRQVPLCMITRHHHHHFPTLSLEHLSLALKLPTLHSLLTYLNLYPD